MENIISAPQKVYDPVTVKPIHYRSAGNLVLLRIHLNAKEDKLKNSGFIFAFVHRLSSFVFNFPAAGVPRGNLRTYISESFLRRA